MDSDNNGTSADPSKEEANINKGGALSNSGNFTAWLELMRISNLPTIWSNVLVGAAITAGAARQHALPVAVYKSVNWTVTIAYIVAVSLFYVGGMALNDVVDAHRDAEHRPSRPIPSGRIELHKAQTFVFLCFAFGLGIVGYIETAALAIAVPLVIVIFLYDFLNKKWSGAILFMGLSRSLVYLLAASDADADFGAFNFTVLMFALILGSYTIAITVIARGEHKKIIDNRKWLSLLMPALALAGGLVIWPAKWLLAVGLGLALLCWMARSVRFVFQKPSKTMQAVLTWLAGISVIDAYFLVLLSAPILALMAGACFVFTLAAHRKILGT